MKNIVKLFAMLAALSLVLDGCGGGGSSSSPVQEASKPRTPPPSELSNSIEINPLRDLGLGEGEYICFKIKSYNNVTESDFSDAACSQIKNNDSLILSWSDGPGNVVGYYVYFGRNKQNATNFLADVIES